MVQVKTLVSDNVSSLDNRVNEFLRNNDSKIESVQDIKYIDNIVGGQVVFKAVIIFKVKKD